MNIKLKDEKIWSVKSCDEEKAKKISAQLSLPLLLSRLLVIRGFDTPDKASDFLSADEYGFCDPFALCDMDKAVERIERAVNNGERVLIYGDYDVDGISSTAALYLYLSQRGANVCYYIPERLAEGYGLNCTAIDKFSAAGIKLIITVDTGITAISEAEYIKKCGMDIVITDHHECRDELPDAAYAVINPKRRDSTYPFSELAGVGVVFKLISALEKNENIDEIYSKYLDIVTLGTIADVMPVYGENRRIVVHGLEALSVTDNVGIRALLSCTIPDAFDGTKKITSSTVGFTLAPRLNAAGRIGEVKKAVELLITKDSERAKYIAEELCALNKERQAIENKILIEAIEQIEKDFDFEKNKVIVLGSDHWHQGVIGIVASRITEKYGLPSILVTFSENVGKGSARSIKGFNINDALTYCGETLIKFGGHELAAGLSVDISNFEDFKAMINDYAYDIITDEITARHVDADLELLPDEIDIGHAEMLSQLEPYGNGNPPPVFLLKGAVIENITPIGANKHLKLLIACGEKKFNAVFFNKTAEDFPYLEGFSVDIAFNLEINEFRGTRNVQLNIRDMKFSEELSRYINRQAKDYLRAIAAFAVKPENLPDMQAFRAAFVFIRNHLKTTKYIDIYKTSVLISKNFSSKVTPCMLNIILDVFSEMGLIGLTRHTLNDAEAEIIDVGTKVNLENSSLLIKLRNSQ